MNKPLVLIPTPLRRRLRRFPRLSRWLCWFGWHDWSGFNVYVGAHGKALVTISFCGDCGADDPDGLAYLDAVDRLTQSEMPHSPYRGKKGEAG